MKIGELNKEIERLKSQHQNIKEIGEELLQRARKLEESIFDNAPPDPTIFGEIDVRSQLEGLDEEDLVGEMTEGVKSINEPEKDVIEISEVTARSETSEGSQSETIDFDNAVDETLDKSREKSEGKKKKSLYGELFEESAKEKK